MMVPPTQRWLFMAASFVGLSVMLAGCDQFLPSPVAIKRDGEALMVVICTTMTANSVTVQERKGAAGAWTPLAETTEPMTIDPGAPIDLLAKTSAGVTGEPRLRAGDGIEIAARGMSGAEEISIYALFTLGQEGLPDDVWTQDGGTVSQEPCEGISDRSGQ